MFWLSSVWECVSTHRISFSTGVYDACEAAGLSQEVKRTLCLWQGAVGAFLRHRDSGRVVLAVNTHISCRWQQPVLQALQVHACLHRMRALATEAGMHDVPMVLCGDFNSQPGCGVYQYLRTGHLDLSRPLSSGPQPDPDVTLVASARPPAGSSSPATTAAAAGTGAAEHSAGSTAYVPAGGDEEAPAAATGGDGAVTPAVSVRVPLPFTELRHTLHLDSAYAVALGREPAFTNRGIFDDGGLPNVFCATLDYIWHTRDTLTPVAVLEGVPVEVAAREVGLPATGFPSDHIPLYAEYAFAPPAGGE